MCGKSYTWKSPHAKQRKEKVWFDRWIREGYSLRQLANQSGWSQTQLKQIKAYWLKQAPPPLPVVFDQYTALVCDGTYFSHTHCLLVLWDATSHTPIASLFCDKENYFDAKAWFVRLHQAGLAPHSITLDGQVAIIRAIHDVWPACIVQRCLYHIIRQGEMWLRQCPKTSLARDLKWLIRQVGYITTVSEKDHWWAGFQAWQQHYQSELTQLNPKHHVEGDIIRAYRLVRNAYPDMFHYLTDLTIPKTSNGLEGYFSHLKQRYRQHPGLRTVHLPQYLQWYIYLTHR